MSLAQHPQYDPILTARQAADYIKCHYKTLLKMARRGALVTCRTPGGRLRFRLSDLNRYVNSLREEPRADGHTDDIDWSA